MSGAFINVGFDNAVSADRIVAVVASDSAPMRRLREVAGRSQKLIDATNGRKTRTLIITDSEHVVLSSLLPETITQRLKDLK